MDIKFKLSVLINLLLVVAIGLYLVRSLPSLNGVEIDEGNLRIAHHESELLIDTIYQDGATWLLAYRDYAAGEVGSAGPYIGQERRYYLTQDPREVALLKRSVERFGRVGRYMRLSFRDSIYDHEYIEGRTHRKKALFLAQYGCWSEF